MGLKVLKFPHQVGGTLAKFARSDHPISGQTGVFQGGSGSREFADGGPGFLTSARWTKDILL